MKTAAILCLCLLIHLSTFAADEADLNAIHRIKQEAFQNGKVMDHLFYLTDVNGPRLSGSPEYRKAAEWAVKELKSWGISNARTESYGPFGRSWSLKRFSAHMLQPSYAPLQALPNAWSPSTAGAVKANVIYAPLFEYWEDSLKEDPDKISEKVREYSAKYKGQFAGKIVLVEPLREMKKPAEVPFQRFTETELAEMKEAPEPKPLIPYEWPITSLPEDEKKRNQMLDSLPLEVSSEFWEELMKSRAQLNAFLKSEGAIASFSVSTRGIGGSLYAQTGNYWNTNVPVGPPVISLEREQYFRMVRLVQKNLPVEVEIELQAEMPEETADGLNVIAEIPGTKKADEVVMIGAHLDSWHSATGTTDNAAGCSVVMEVLRILKKLNLRLDRTVRLALWGGEEQNLYGSRAYVQKYLADPVSMELKPGHPKLSGYFNLDNGTGKIRGVYLQGNDMMRPIFESWLAPFKDMGVSTLTIRDTTGTDHLSFDAVGIPGFQFIQDDIEYSIRTHHSNLDQYDHAQQADLMQASAVMASVIYHAANRKELLPRKPLPSPLPPKTKSTK